MDIPEVLEQILSDLLTKLDLSFTGIEITEEESGNYAININSEDPSTLIGHHGMNIQAIQHIVKILAWAKAPNQQFNIKLDVDNYRKRREEKILEITQRKVDMARKNGRPQSLPPMTPYLRRKVHMYCMGAGFEDIETISQGENERRHIIIKLKV